MFKNLKTKQYFKVYEKIFEQYMILIYKNLQSRY